jgi:dipeptidyl aminopeptidase/acylaminoacyl peptidase
MHLMGPSDLGLTRWAVDAQISPDSEQVAWCEVALDLTKDQPVSNIMVSPSKGGTLRRFTDGPHDLSPRWSPDGQYLAFLAATDGPPVLHLAPLAGGVPTKVEAPGPVSWIAWSPTGDALVLVVTVGPLAATTPEPKADNEVKVVRGMYNRLDGRGWLSGRDHLFVYDLATKKVRQLTKGEYDHDQPNWSPDGTTITFVSDRTPRRDDFIGTSDLCEVRVTSGRVRYLVRKVVDLSSPSYSPDGKSIAFVGSIGSDRPLAGRDQHLFMMPVDGSKEPERLAPSFDRSVIGGLPTGNFSWLSNRELIFRAIDRGTVSVQRVRVGERSARLVVSGDLQVSSCTVAKRKGVLRLAYSAAWLDAPSEVFLLDLSSGAKRGRKLSLAGSDLLKAVELLPARRHSVKALDGRPIEYFVLSPKSRAGRRGAPPMFLDIHGGPNSLHPQLALAQHYQALAAAGYAVVLPNPRGSKGYGEEFTGAVNGDWGGGDYQDLLKCADDVIQRGLADPQRQFVGGYSYGGYMSSWIVGQSDRFKAACVGAPVTDLVSAFGAGDAGPWIVESMNATPWHDEDLLRVRSPVTYAPNVNTPVMLYVNEGDLRCPTDQADAFFNSLRYLGKEVEYFRYPGGSHASAALIAGPPSQNVDRLQRILDFLGRHGGTKVRGVKTETSKAAI